MRKKPSRTQPPPTIYTSPTPGGGLVVSVGWWPHDRSVWCWRGASAEDVERHVRWVAKLDGPYP